MIRAEFKRRLYRLADAIIVAIARDSTRYGLIPALFSVFSYMWCKDVKSLELQSPKRKSSSR